MDVCVGFQVDLELPVGTWFLAVRCAEIEIVVVVLWKECPRVHLWAFEYLFVDGEVRLSQGGDLGFEKVNGSYLIENEGDSQATWS